MSVAHANSQLPFAMPQQFLPFAGHYIVAVVVVVPPRHPRPFTNSRISFVKWFFVYIARAPALDCYLKNKRINIEMKREEC